MESRENVFPRIAAGTSTPTFFVPHAELQGTDEARAHIDLR